MKGPWTNNDSRDDLHVIRLEDSVQAKDQRSSTRPCHLHGAVHEVALILVAVFVGATFLILQRGTAAITNTVRYSLGMDAAAISWVPSSSG